VKVEVGCGLTVIVNVLGGPGQVPRVGVMVMVEVIGDAVALVAVKAGNPPVPLPPSPIAVLELVQLNVAPAGVLAKVLAATAVPAHTAIFVSAVTVGTGFTVSVVTEVQVAPATVAVTV
jgi:hypothetical protein